MYLGAIVEVATCDEIFASPRHPYTQALMSAIPLPDPNKERQRRRIPLTGEVTGSQDLPRGCRFSPRCFKAQPICGDREPPLDLVAPEGHLCACYFQEPRTVV
jgi:oligopeptide/dipeptide ABC transporter ATP-binding protein